MIIIVIGKEGGVEEANVGGEEGREKSDLCNKYVDVLFWLTLCKMRV